MYFFHKKVCVKNQKLVFHVSPSTKNINLTKRKSPVSISLQRIKWEVQMSRTCVSTYPGTKKSRSTSSASYRSHRCSTPVYLASWNLTFKVITTNTMFWTAPQTFFGSTIRLLQSSLPRCTPNKRLYRELK